MGVNPDKMWKYLANFFHIDASLFYSRPLALVFGNTRAKGRKRYRIQLQGIILINMIILVPGDALPGVNPTEKELISCFHRIAHILFFRLVIIDTQNFVFRI